MIMTDNTLIEDALITFHNTAISDDIKIVNSDERFGILKLKLSKVPITQTPTLFVFSIDRSGSMNESDFRKPKKIEYVKQTLKNIINFLSKQNNQNFIHIKTFNDAVETIIDTTLITPSNKDDLITNVQDINAEGSTNIGQILISTNEFIKKYMEEHPKNQIAHIFMSDGDATNGITDIPELIKLGNDKYSNIFIGFGSSHNYKLMKNISDVTNGEYQFIDDFENTSLIYGQAIHQFLYPCMKNVVISADDDTSQIYDWKKNVWTNSIHERMLIGETERIYHIKTKQTSDISINLISDLNNDVDVPVYVIHTLPELLNLETGDIVDTDLTKYLYRQLTQELLFKVANDNESNNIELKIELKQLFTNMRRYMIDKSLTEDAFMKNLCDDTYIAYNTFGKKTGVMFSASRQSSQGRQQTVSLTPIKKQFNIPILKRAHSLVNNTEVVKSYINDSSSDDDTDELNETISDYYENIDIYLPSLNNTTCYATQGELDTLNEISFIDFEL